MHFRRALGMITVKFVQTDQHKRISHANTHHAVVTGAFLFNVQNMSLPHHHTHGDKPFVHIGKHTFTATQHHTHSLPALEKPHLEWFALLLPFLGCHGLARREHLLAGDPISLRQGTPVQMLQIHSIQEVFIVLAALVRAFRAT